jgi:membrane-bound metal-dependent hydrolase YbcI (DUF457 family)
MPLTPFHFGPTTLMGLPIRRRLDLPVFLLANVVIDIEVLIVLLLPFDLPLHAVLHNYLLGGIAGSLWGRYAWRFREYFARFMGWAKIPYTPRSRTMILSGVLGAWTHVFVDGFMHADMRPFWPFAGNPFLGLVTGRELYLICTLCLVALGLWYLRYYLRYGHKRRRRF